ncbi:MAG: hypothetical protein PVS3B1_13240 [Ktedonobacteraceae bacterium]
MEIKGTTTTDGVEAREPEIVRKHSRKRSIIIFVVVSLLNVGLLAVLWTQLLTPRASAPQSPNDPSIVGFISSPLVGKPAPDFKLPTLNGSAKQLRLADLKGKPVILNFWSSSCPPCQVETPFLQKSWPVLQTRGVSLIGVDGYEQTSNAQGFLKRYGVTYPNVQDTLDGATGISFGVTGNPETYFIDKDGVVVARWIGALNEQGLQSGLAKTHLN